MSTPAWPTQVPTTWSRTDFETFEFQGESERGKFSVFKGLQKPSFGADSKKLKPRRSPPTSAFIHGF
jgi:hypothetical protein